MYIKKQAFIILLATVLLLALVAVWPVLAGNTNSPGVPGSTSSYTLQDIYARLTSGTAGSQSTFTEPATGPGSTMADLNTIMAAAPAVDATNGAAAADVASGKTFWGLLPGGGWGPQTGTAASAGAKPYVWIPRTGQTTCYNGGTPVTCDGTGQDGESHMGSTVLPVLAPSTGVFGAYTLDWSGTSRFTDNGDGTVTDDLTGLIWLKDADCIQNEYPGFDTFATAGDGYVSWQQTLDFVAGINAGTYSNCGGGQTDWRLPNINELHSLIDLSQANPALPSGHPFTGIKTYYWSSTPIITIAGPYTFANAWYVRPSDGYVTGTSQTFNNPGMSAWPVRGGQ